jgi:RNA polymerase sigma-70 factor (ECF subfamily)
LKVSASSTRPIEDPLAYLYRAANNLMLDRARAAIRRVKREQEYTGPEVGIEPADESPGSDRQLIAREELRAVVAELAALGGRTEDVFRRFRLAGQSQRDIAADLGISLSAVEKHLQKAYRVLLIVKRRSNAD